MFLKAGAAMFKVITTLVRGQSEAAEAIAGLKADRDAGQAAQAGQAGQAAQAQLAAAIATAAGGTMGRIPFMPVAWWMRGFLVRGVRVIVQSCITVAQSRRDLLEGTRLVNRIEDARAEKLLMDTTR